jgi:hypothetical protein
MYGSDELIGVLRSRAIVNVYVRYTEWRAHAFGKCVWSVHIHPWTLQVAMAFAIRMLDTAWLHRLRRFVR